MPAGLSFFNQSVSPDWLKEETLCDRWASVVQHKSGASVVN